MRTFTFDRADGIGGAIDAAAAGAKYYAGGTNLLDLMKGGVETPTALVDIRRLELRAITPTDDGGVLIGAGATNSAVANHPLIRTQYPVLSQSILSGATTQIRNMATIGGNLLQRTRCPYFMDTSFAHCNKRSPGTGCAAREGFNREHALFGASESCVAVHPSDMAVALVILEATVQVQGPKGRRSIPMGDFLVLPGETPHRDNVLRPAELITGVALPPSHFAEHSWYLKVRDRHSYAFALVSVAAGVRLEDGVISSAALAVGGVAAKPWRVGAAEDRLVGCRPDAEAFRAAARLFGVDAVPLSQNGFKLDLVMHSVVRALEQATRSSGSGLPQ